MNQYDNFDVCVYHGGCLDGFTSAWVVHNYSNSRNIKFIPGRHGSPMPDDLLACKNKKILFVDFSYKRNDILELIGLGNEVTILDHHITARDDLVPLFEQDVIGGVFDMTRSGAGITYDYFTGNEARIPLIDYVEDRDLWKFDYSYTKPFIAYLFSQEQTFDNWCEIAAKSENPVHLKSYINMGNAILDQQKIIVDKYVRKANDVGTIQFMGYEVFCVNASHTIASDLGNILCQGMPFSISYEIYHNGIGLNFRSDKDTGIDVSQIARKLGGGGHKNASGCTLPFSDFQKLIDGVYP